jgi:hypothetical protein
MRNTPSPEETAETDWLVSVLRTTMVAAAMGRETDGDTCSRTMPSRAAVVRAWSRGMRFGGADSAEILAEGVLEESGSCARSKRKGPSKKMMQSPAGAAHALDGAKCRIQWKR